MSGYHDDLAFTLKHARWHDPESTKHTIRVLTENVPQSVLRAALQESDKLSKVRRA